MGRTSTVVAVLAVVLAPAFACGRTEIWDGESVVTSATDAGPRHDADAASPAPDAQADAPFDAIGDDGSTRDSGDDSDAGPPGPPPPRPTAPLSTATVTSQTPLLHWVLASGEDGAEVDICRDRACTARVSTFMATGSSAMPPIALTQGVYFWRIRGASGSVVGKVSSPVWEFFVGVRSATQNSSWGSILDVNGDGFADVMIGAPNISGTTESVYLYVGGVNGMATTPKSWTYPEHPNGYYRDPIASAGDIDGDGFGDVIIGAPDVTTGGGPGVVLVFRGGPSGLPAMPTSLPSPSGVGGSFGWFVSGAGDINGDGYADVIIGANSMIAGALVYYGSASGLSGVPTELFSFTDPVGHIAYVSTAMGAGDIDGDGFGDVVVGLSQGEYTFIFRGSAGGLSTTPATVLAAPHHPDTGTTPGFGSSVACAGDVNADGFADVIVGAHADGNGYNAVGSAYLYFGGASGLSTTAMPLPNPSAFAGGAFGAYVGGGGDINGDGYADMLAATNNDSYVFLGSPGGPSALGIHLDVPGGGQNFDFAQGALGSAGDVDGDGFADVLTGAPDSNSYVGGAYLYLGSLLGPGGPLTVANPGGASGFFGASVAMRMNPRR